MLYLIVEQEKMERFHMSKVFSSWRRPRFSSSNSSVNLSNSFVLIIILGRDQNKVVSVESLHFNLRVRFVLRPDERRPGLGCHEVGGAQPDNCVLGTGVLDASVFGICILGVFCKSGACVKDA